MPNENYISTYTIGQVIKKGDKYWQITSLTNPSTGDWFIADSHTIVCCPSYLYFNECRYIVQEVSITPVTVKVNVIEDKDNEKLPVGKIITLNNHFYEVIDYRVPNRDEHYIYPATDNVVPPYVYKRRGTIDYEKPYNIVTKIQPYKLGQVITFCDKSYTVVDYNFPKKDQVIVSPPDMNVYINPWAWNKGKAFILEPTEPPDPEATVYKPGQLIVRDGLVYRVIAYRKAKKGEYTVHSDLPRAPRAVICDINESVMARWVVEPYFVS